MLSLKIFQSFKLCVNPSIVNYKHNPEGEQIIKYESEGTNFVFSRLKIESVTKKFSERTSNRNTKPKNIYSSVIYVQKVQWH